MIDDDKKVAVMLKRSPKELTDHFVLESPQLAEVEFKFSVMRGLVQHWCQSRRVFTPQNPPMEIAAVSAGASDSDVTVSAVSWHGSWHEEGHGKGKSREKGKEKGKGKGKGKKGKEEGGEKDMGKSNSGNGKGSWWNEQQDQRWTEPFHGYCGNCWKWAIRRPNALNGRSVARWNLVQ